MRRVTAVNAGLIQRRMAACAVLADAATEKNDDSQGNKSEAAVTAASAPDHNGPLRFRAVYQRAPQGVLRENSRDGRDRHHESDAGFVPFLDREQIDGEVRPNGIAVLT